MELKRINIIEFDCRPGERVLIMKNMDTVLSYIVPIDARARVRVEVITEYGS